MIDIDNIAEAIWRVDRANEAAHYTWDQCHFQATYRAMVHAAIDALQLTQEWGVQITENGKTVIETHPGAGEPMDREVAFYENERWLSYGYNTEGVRSRFVSPWVEEQPSDGA